LVRDVESGTATLVPGTGAVEPNDVLVHLIRMIKVLALKETLTKKSWFQLSDQRARIFHGLVPAAVFPLGSGQTM
jgi:hypothetical protein